MTRGGLAPSLFDGVKQQFLLDENRTRKEETDLDDLFNSNSRSWNGIVYFWVIQKYISRMIQIEIANLNLLLSQPPRSFR